MTMEWKKARRNKRKFAIYFAKNRTPENFELKRKYRNIATRKRRKAIKEYWNTNSEELKSKLREFYNTFRPFISTKAKDSNSICLRTDTDKVEKDQTVVAEHLVNYFSKAAANIGGDHVNSLTEDDHVNHTSVQAISDAYEGTPFDFKYINKAEVQHALESTNPRKSCGWDLGAPPKLLKQVASGIAPSLTSLFNNCIELSQWPCAWKMGDWTPVFKKGDRQVDKNYRPITSLITVDKIFEQLLSKQITGHYDSTLYSRMTAYRSKHSCETS